VHERPIEEQVTIMNCSFAENPISRTALEAVGINIRFGERVLLKNAEFRLQTGSLMTNKTLCTYFINYAKMIFGCPNEFRFYIIL
jgi:hypothetical protein